jgi:acetyl-CoA synthetase
MKIYSLDKVRLLSSIALRDLSLYWWDKRNLISWFSQPRETMTGSFPMTYWYPGGYTNISYNALDRHLQKLKNKVSFYYVNERNDEKSISYLGLYDEVNKASFVLKEIGVKEGDSVSLMMPSSIDAVVMGLAVHRLGAKLVIHYTGLSEDTLAYRIKDSKSRFFIVASKGFKGGNEIRMKDMVDKVLSKHETGIEKVIVISRGFGDFDINQGRDVIYEEVKPKGRVYIEPAKVESNDPSTIYYTSGTTGRPKGIWHSTGGYIVALNYAFRTLFNPMEEDVWWTVSELGWPVWPMANLYTIPVMGLTGVLFEGSIAYKAETFSRIVEKFQVNLIWSSTTSLYTLRGLGEESVSSGETSSLRIILNTGEPLNPGALDWFNKTLPHVMIGDAYWMTEHLIPIACTPFGIAEIPVKPGSAGIAFPGVSFKVVDDDSKPLPPRARGYIVVETPNPALGKVWGDDRGEELIKKYYSRFHGYFYTGDFGYYDEDGYLYILGRADDVINAKGERIGTLDIEGVIGKHRAIAECAVVSYRVDNTEKIMALVSLKQGESPSDTLKEEIRETARNSGFILDEVVFVKRLPKTKSGKIMRRLIRAIAKGEEFGDVSTLDDIKVIEELRETMKSYIKGKN